MQLLAPTAALQWRCWPSFTGALWSNNQSLFRPEAMQQLDHIKTWSCCEALTLALSVHPNKTAEDRPRYDQAQHQWGPMDKTKDWFCLGGAFAAGQADLRPPLPPLPLNTLHVLTALCLSAGPDTISTNPWEACAQEIIRVLSHLKVKQLFYFFLKKKKSFITKKKWGEEFGHVVDTVTTLSWCRPVWLHSGNKSVWWPNLVLPDGILKCTNSNLK